MSDLLSQYSRDPKLHFAIPNGVTAHSLRSSALNDETPRKKLKDWKQPFLSCYHFAVLFWLALLHTLAYIECACLK